MIHASLSAAGAGERGRVVRTLKDGYWERTEIVVMPDGARRVRKRSKGDAPPGPWGVNALRREIEYLTTLPPAARPVFPPVLAAWDGLAGTTPSVGYEIPYYADHADAGELARRGALAQPEIDAFQETLAEALLECVHAPIPPTDPPLSEHMAAVVHQALRSLETDPALAPLINAESIRLNGESLRGLRAAIAQLEAEGAALTALDEEPQVRLHGDCFLENILWRPAKTQSAHDAPQLVLVDPVSVAGIVRGPPVFDLVKYESYATGELPALRSEWVDVAGFEGGDDFQYHLRRKDAVFEPYRTRDWHTRFRRAFEARHGAVDRRIYQLIDGYFSVAMAVNTGGVQRRARLLKAALELNAVLALG
ncbi:MAG: phosphotransferase [Opitutaceae bacterium]